MYRMPMTCNSVHEIGSKYTALASAGGTYFHLDSISLRVFITAKICIRIYIDDIDI